MALQWAFGCDNPNVVRFIGRSLDHSGFSTPLPLIKDGDLITIVQHMYQARGADTVRVTQSRVMPLKIGLVIPRLTLRLIWAGATSLNSYGCQEDSATGQGSLVLRLRLMV